MTLNRADWLVFNALRNTEPAQLFPALPGSRAEWNRLIRGGFVRTFDDAWRAGAPFATPRGIRLRARIHAIKHRKAPSGAGKGT